MGSIPIVSNGVKMASSLRGLTPKKKQAQVIEDKTHLKSELVVEATNVTPVIEEPVNELVDSVNLEVSSEASLEDAVQAVEALIEATDSTPAVESLAQPLEVSNISSSIKKMKKQNSKKKGMENQS